MFNLAINTFQKYVISKDIRKFKKNFFYYLFFRLVRSSLHSKIKIKIYNFFILVSNDKNRMSFSLLRKCEFDDQKELNLLKKISDRSKIFFFDCGANFGFYSLFIASLNQKNKILAFEASPKTLEEFEKNIEINNFKSIQVKNLAVSNLIEDKLDFYESEKDWESSVDKSNFNKGLKISVKTTTLDKVSENISLTDFFTVMKIDVEGHEMNVIEGSLNLIENFSPLIIIEFSKFISKNEYYNYSYLKKFMTKYNYVIYDAKYKKINLDIVLDRIKKLPSNMYGIGNNFLVKENSIFEEIIINVGTI
jgi:FkbM family methyltransferase